ncbi:hypothetical protein [Actinomadura rugatobispora]|uniref:Nuclear transport factor 2 family protein n=1 Tax=Actinomadura rugatobispora TaxID=1994 RepID=A0ABW0ZPW6_9ACTN|nr:hypothetical protein GCM10010200_034760 [Actinomadura rugatobispora]
MSLEEQILEVELEQWKILSSDDGAAFYRDRLLKDALMAVPAPHGIMDRDTVVSEVTGAPPIVEYELFDPKVVLLTPDSGVIVYSMWQRRKGQEGFKAAISSVYTVQDGELYMAYHQQTRL